MTKTRYSKKGIVTLCAIVYFTSYFSRKSFAVALAGILTNAGAGLTETTAGLIETAMFICYGAGQLLSGFLGDRIKPAILLGTGLGVTAVCNLALPFMPSGEWMIPIWALNGLAQAMLWPPIVRILSDHLDHERYVRANFVVTSAAHAATILLYLYVPICLKFSSWKTAFYSAAGLAAVIMAVFLVAVSVILPKEPTATNENAEKTKAATPKTQKLSTILWVSGVIPIFGSIIMCGILRDGIETWLPTLYCQAFDRTPEEATVLSIILPIFSVLAVSLVTMLHKKSFFNNEVRGTSVLFLFAVALCLPLALLLSVEHTVARFAALLLAALVCAAMHGINFLLISCLPGRFARFGRASTVGGLVNAFIYIGAAAATYGFALITKYAGWSITTLSWAGVGIIGIIPAILAYRKYTVFIKEKVE